MTPKWRQFEQLVSLIEQLLAPAGAIVKSPDSVDDLDGTPREVDATVRYRLGSTEILVAIECRRRGGMQDKTWIEQLASKRDAIRASKLIAVSRSRFSKGAKKAAARYGIDLRTVREFSKEDIASWCSLQRVSIVTHHHSLVSMRLILEEGAVAPPIPLNGGTKNQPLFSYDGLAPRISALALSDIIRRDVKEPAKLSATKTRRGFLHRRNNRPLFVHTAGGVFRVLGVEAVMDSWASQKTFSAKHEVHYGDPDGKPVRQVSFPFAVGEWKSELLVTHDQETGATKVVIPPLQPSSGDDLPEPTELAAGSDPSAKPGDGIHIGFEVDPKTAFLRMETPKGIVLDGDKKPKT